MFRIDDDMAGPEPVDWEPPLYDSMDWLARAKGFVLTFVVAFLAVAVWGLAIIGLMEVL